MLLPLTSIAELFHEKEEVVTSLSLSSLWQSAVYPEAIPTSTVALLLCIYNK